MDYLTEKLHCCTYTPFITVYILNTLVVAIDHKWQLTCCNNNIKGSVLLHVILFVLTTRQYFGQWPAIQYDMEERTWQVPSEWDQGPVSLRLMTSQFKDIVTHTQKYKTVKCTFCGVWVPNFVWNFKGALWNFTQNFEPIHRKMCILRGGKNLTTYDILKLWHLKS